MVKKSAKERSNCHDRFLLGYSLVSKVSPKNIRYLAVIEAKIFIIYVYGPSQTNNR